MKLDHRVPVEGAELAESWRLSRVILAVRIALSWLRWNSRSVRSFFREKSEAEASSRGERRESEAHLAGPIR